MPTERRHPFPVRRELWLALVVSAVSLTAGGAIALGHLGRSTAANAHRSLGTIQILSLKRAGDTSSVWVYRPKVKDSADLPVLYFLHGLPGEPADVFRDAGVERVLDKYIARGGAPLVVAAPDGNSPVHADTEWGNASDGSDSVERFFLNAVIPAVEGSHRRDAAHRAIAGFSMGGYGAMNIALRHPGLFGQIVSLCGYFHLDDPSRMFATPASQRANDPDLNAARARGHHILLMDGLQDGEALTNHQSQAFKLLLDQAGVPSKLVMAPGTHGWSYVGRQFPVVLRFLAAGWGKALAG